MAPTPAASVIVANPKIIDPSTAKISINGGKSAVISEPKLVFDE